MAAQLTREIDTMTANMRNITNQKPSHARTISANVGLGGGGQPIPPYVPQG